MPDNNKYEYIYPVEELDKYIEQMMNGIQPMLDDQMLTEVKIRWAERQRDEFGVDDEEELDEETLREHNEILKRKVQDSNRKALRRDVVIIKISDEQKAKIREEMSVSIVRPDPNDPYNNQVDKTVQSEESRIIREKLKGLRNSYSNQTDYVNAINIIKEAIEVSLGKYGDGDYPWLTYEDAVKEFNAGKIKLSIQIPKLIINYSTIISDPEVLKGIISGEVVLKNRNEEEEEQNYSRRKKKEKYNPVYVDYEITGSEEYAQMVEAHRNGYDTPMSTVIRHKSTIYNPKQSPLLRNKGIGNSNNNVPELYDWMREGAGDDYYDLINNRKPRSSDIVRAIDEANNNEINTVLYNNVNSFLSSMKSGSSNTGGYDYTLPNYMQPPTDDDSTYNVDAANIERELLQQIKLNNPK